MERDNKILLYRNNFTYYFCWDTTELNPSTVYKQEQWEVFCVIKVKRKKEKESILE